MSSSDFRSVQWFSPVVLERFVEGKRLLWYFYSFWPPVFNILSRIHFLDILRWIEKNVFGCRNVRWTIHSTTVVQMSIPNNDVCPSCFCSLDAFVCIRQNDEIYNRSWISEFIQFTRPQPNRFRCHLCGGCLWKPSLVLCWMCKRFDGVLPGRSAFMT